MSSGVLGYHEMYITEIAECIRKIYVKQKEKKWVAWVQNGDIYFSPHTQEVLVVYNAVNPQPYKKARQSQYIGSVRPGRIAANMLRTAERPFQRKNIGHAAEKQFWKGLRIEDFLLAGHKCTV